MGKAAKSRALRRRQDPDRHLPDVTGPIAPGTLDRPTLRAAIPRVADFWHELPSRRVACDLCYRRCELAPGEAGWCDLRRNDGGRLRLAEHGVIGNLQPHVTHYFYWRQHARMVWVSGVDCTADCVFCTSTDLARAPERLTWGPSGERAVGQHSDAGGWAYHRAMLHPQMIPALAEQWGCRDVYFGANEPTLTYEWTLDAARLAKGASLGTVVDTNGFTAPDAIAALAPFMDMAYAGVKGSADPAFYAKRMRAEGAVPHVLAALEAWHASPTMLGVSDTIAPPHWCDEATATETMTRFYSWIAETLGPLTPLQVRGMVRPAREYGEWFDPLLPHAGGDGAVVAFMERLRLAEAIARDCGLRYVYSDEHREVRCHHCGGVLVGKIGSVAFDLHVGPDGVCAHCGGQTPIVGISRAEYDAIQREEG
jgi:pyruvate formate lyase activating enzyme